MAETNIDPHYFNVTWKEFYRDARALAWRVKDLQEWKGILAITRGGLVPAGVIARELNIRTIDTISIVSYDDDDNKQSDISVVKKASIQGDGENWLVIDDLADTGMTAKLVRKLYPKAHIATVYVKPEGTPHVDSYITTVSQNTWIVFPWEEEN